MAADELDEEDEYEPGISGGGGTGGGEQSEYEQPPEIIELEGYIVYYELPSGRSARRTLYTPADHDDLRAIDEQIENNRFLVGYTSLTREYVTIIQVSRIIRIEEVAVASSSEAVDLR